MPDYDRELVEQLLPAVWDSSFAFGMEQPYAPDPDMPRAKQNPQWGCTLYAHLADIRVGWRTAPLTLDQRRALVMAYGIGMQQREIAAHEGVTRQAIGARLDAAVGRISATLNGSAIDDEGGAQTE